ncbi:MAG TPA: hypothetical protein DCP63_02180 [Bacteroidetes bacterium]|nr:hypothetical protein [Bacteroidota bacterium]
MDNSEYPASLELQKVYRVVPDKDAVSDNDLRIIDESGEDYLCPSKYFVPVELPNAIVSSLGRQARVHSKRRLQT